MPNDSDISDIESDADSVDEIIAQFKRQDSDEDDNEGIFDIASDVDDDDNMDDDDDEDEQSKFNLPDKYEIIARKEEMASDLEDSEEEEEDGPDAKQWGSKKSDYYSTDYVDTGRRHKIDVREEGKAEAEEAEAIAIQKRLMSEMKDVDLGFDLDDKYEQSGVSAAGSGPAASNQADDDDEDNEDEEDGPVERVKMNTDGLSDREKEQLLRRLHPELIPILEDFNSCLKEASDVLEPIIQYSETNAGRSLKSLPGFHVINLKYRLMKAYMQTMAQYFLLKCRSVDVKKHAITARLFNFKKLIREVETIMDEKSLGKKDMKLLSAKINSNQVISFPAPSSSSSSDQLLQEIDIDHQFSLRRDAAGGASSSSSTTTGRMNRLMRESVAPDDERRGVTDEMKSNRGMTAVRKKEIKNPRVKHRLKYKKAVVRRKGQVRAPRKEVTKYAGEVSGIKGHLVRSIKFKN